MSLEHYDGTEPTGLAKDLARVGRLLRRAKVASELQSILGRELSDTEMEWLADGWEPASIKAEL